MHYGRLEKDFTRNYNFSSLIKFSDVNSLKINAKMGAVISLWLNYATVCVCLDCACVCVHMLSFYSIFLKGALLLQQTLRQWCV